MGFRQLRNHLFGKYGIIGESGFESGDPKGVRYQKGLAQLDDGSYVMIERKEWFEQECVAYILSYEEALQEIVRSENLDLLDEPAFLPLKSLFERKNGTR